MHLVLLETRKFECLCGQKAEYEIYVRAMPINIFSCLDCNRHYHFDWKTDKFVSELKPKLFEIKEADE